MKVDLDGNIISNRALTIVIDSNSQLELDLENKCVVYNNYNDEIGETSEIVIASFEDLVGLSKASNLAVKLGWLRKLEAID